MDLRPIIKKHCKLHGITQKELAAKIGMKENTFNIALGKATFNIATLENIANAFGVSVSELLQEDSKQQHTPEVKEVTYLHCPQCGAKIHFWVKAEETETEQQKGVEQ